MTRATPADRRLRSVVVRGQTRLVSLSLSRSSWLLCCVVWSLQAGCGAKTGLSTTADGGRSASRGPGSGTTADAGSGLDGPPGLDLEAVPECPFADGAVPETRGAYPFCQWVRLDGAHGGYEIYCPPTIDGWGYMNWHAAGKDASYCPEDADCNACLCAHHCTADADCPRADSGEARAECVEYVTGSPSIVGPRQCLLTCDHNERCPDGMNCVRVADYGRFGCAWVTTGDRCG